MAPVQAPPGPSERRVSVSCLTTPNFYGRFGKRVWQSGDLISSPQSISSRVCCAWSGRRSDSVVSQSPVMFFKLLSLFAYNSSRPSMFLRSACLRVGQSVLVVQIQGILIQRGSNSVYFSLNRAMGIDVHLILLAGVPATFTKQSYLLSLSSSSALLWCSYRFQIHKIRIAPCRREVSLQLLR